MSKLRAVPIERRDANDFVDRMHRHHCASVGDKYRIGVAKDGRLCGVIQVGRPVARGLDDGSTVEALRCCTDGTYNACSFLYGAAARIAKEMGYKKIVTYILASESGASLKAAGYHKEADVKGKSWSCPSRPRSTKSPECDKERWAKVLNDA